ncbi:hypothetical protein MMC25_006160 [Agyrium rufum]|nr:hypothetical protein [Agyrium rufum]
MCFDLLHAYLKPHRKENAADPGVPIRTIPPESTIDRIYQPDGSWVERRNGKLYLVRPSKRKKSTPPPTTVATTSTLSTSSPPADPASTPGPNAPPPAPAPNQHRLLSETAPAEHRGRNDADDANGPVPRPGERAFRTMRTKYRHRPPILADEFFRNERSGFSERRSRKLAFGLPDLESTDVSEQSWQGRPQEAETNDEGTYLQSIDLRVVSIIVPDQGQSFETQFTVKYDLRHPTTIPKHSGDAPKSASFEKLWYTNQKDHDPRVVDDTLSHES